MARPEIALIGYGGTRKVVCSCGWDYSVHGGPEADGYLRAMAGLHLERRHGVARAPGRPRGRGAPRRGREKGQGSPQQLLPPSLRPAIPPLGATDGQGGDAVAHVRLFLPGTGWAWYVTEFDGRDLCFGLVRGAEVELGYFSLRELVALRSPMGLGVERDASFEPTPLAELAGCPDWLKKRRP